MMYLLRYALLAGPTALLLLAMALGKGHAYPGSVYTSAGPVQGPDIASGTEVPDGTYAVASRTGAASYRFAIAVPPGRHGMQPSLDLTYSSQNPLRGGVAAGWSLDVPVIRVDTSQGRLVETRYTSSLAGGQTLVPVAEPDAQPGTVAYRAEHDAGYARYHFIPLPGTAGMWRVMTTDGVTHYFGENPASRDEPGPHDTGDGARWFLTRSVDRHGNTVRYVYETVTGDAMNGRLEDIDVDIRLARIDYSENPNDGLGPHAQIVFEYHPHAETCPGSKIPVGAQFDFTAGIRLYEGASRLTRITVKVNDGGWQRRREIDLGYDLGALGYDGGAMTCDRGHAPMRLLTSITERGWNRDGELVEREPITFDYGRARREFSDETPIDGLDGTVGRGMRRLNPDKAGGWPTTDLEYVDVDGDSRPDRLRSLDEVTCDIETERNEGGGAFGAAIAGAMWSMPWSDDGEPGPNDGGDSDWMKEGCNLAYQLSRRATRTQCGGIAANYLAYRRLDLNGDGLPEIVTALDAKIGKFNALDTDSGMNTDYGECVAAPPCDLDDQTEGMCITRFDMAAAPIYSGPGGTSPLPFTDCTLSGGGCPDPGCFYGPDAGTSCPCAHEYCPGAGGYLAIGTYYDPPDNKPPWDEGGSPWSWPGRSFQPGDLAKEDDDSSAQAGTVPACRYRPERTCDRYVWRVQWNQGDGVYSAPSFVLSPTPLESDRATSAVGGHAGPASSWHTFIDIDGDGNLDAVWQNPSYIAPNWSGDLQVFRGDGRGGFDGPYHWSVPPVLDRVRVSLSGSGYVTDRKTENHFHRYNEQVVSLRDINGDGLPDLVYSLPADEFDDQIPFARGRQLPLRVYYNHGTGFESSPEARYGTTLATDFHVISRQESVVLTEDPATRENKVGFSVHTQRALDVDEDGLLDVVALPSPSDGAVDPWQVSGAVTPYFNVGDRLVRGEGEGLAQVREALQRIHVSDENVWEVKTDLRDLDGDGRLDAYVNPRGWCPNLETPNGIGDETYGPGTWASCGTAGWVLADPAKGPHLLRSVRNGRGATISFDYAPSSSEVVDDSKAGRRNPRAMWVVASMTVDPGAGPAGTTSYAYRGPVVNRDARGRFGFRGFEEVEIVGPANAAGERATTVERYDYRLDPTGRLRDIVSLDGNNDVISIQTTLYEEFELFGGAVTTYHEVVRATWTCNAETNGGNGFNTNGGFEAKEAACREDGAVRRVVSMYRPRHVVGSGPGLDPGGFDFGGGGDTGGLDSGGIDFGGGAGSIDTDGWDFGGSDIESEPVVPQPGAELPDETVDPLEGEPNPCKDDLGPPVAGSVAVLYVKCGQRVTASGDTEVLAGDRRIAWKHILHSDGDLFLVLGERSEKWVATAGSTSGWGSLRRIGKTRTFYDGGKQGLPVKTRVWQNGGTAADTRRGFDLDNGNVRWVKQPRQVASGGSAIEQRFYDEWKIYPEFVTNEAGHATQTEYDLASGEVLKGATLQPEGPTWEETVYDGFGRPISRWRYTGDWTTVSRRMHERIAYCDHMSPPRARTTSLLDYASSDIVGDACTGAPAAGTVTRDVELDGLGRAVEVTTWGEGGAAVTRYDRDPAGNVVTMTAPNPEDDGASSVQYTWFHDALGRVIAWTPPIGASETITYDGLVETRAQVNVDPGDAPKTVTTTNDVHGRLVGVEEVGPDGPAITSYEYDGNDNMSAIVDADGMRTEMDHDWTGNRTRVEVDGVQWRYHYDLDGNLARVDHPRPADADAPPDPDEPQSVRLEAEDGTLTSPPYASLNWSGTGFIFVPSNAPDRTTPSDNAVATYTFDVDRPGEFRVWGRILAMNASSNSFFVQIDDGPVWSWETVQTGFMLRWDAVNDFGAADPATAWLGVGSHTLRVYQAESGVALDKLVVTDDAGFTPSGEASDVPVDSGASLAYSTIYTHDPLGRVVTTWYGTRSLSADQVARYGVGPVIYEYDDPSHAYASGRRTAVLRPTGHTEYQYTPEGWLAEEEVAFTVDPFGNWSFSDTRAHRYEYGAMGQVVRAEHPDGPSGLGGTVTTTTYDAHGLPDSSYVEVSGNPRAVQLASIHRGRTALARDRVSGSWGQTWDYDRRGRIVDHAATGPGAAVAGETIAFDSVGNVKSVTSKATDMTIDYTYDEQHQLRTAAADDPATYSAYFEYSPAGKVRFLDVTVAEGAPTAFSRQGNVSHGPMGFVTGIADPAAPFGGAAYTAVADERGAIAGRTVAGGADGTFVYDGDGKLREYDDGITREVYYYDGDRRILAFTDTGQTPTGRLWLGDAIVRYDPGGVTERELHVSLSAQSVARLVDGEWNDPQYLFHGVLGSLLAVYDSDSVLARFAYGPYGEILWKEEQQRGDFTQLFNGKEHDQASGLVYYGYRYYDAITLGWTETDPLYRLVPDLAFDEPRRAALYSFSLNNPLRYRDPDGRDSGDADDSNPPEAGCDPMDEVSCGREYFDERRKKLAEKRDELKEKEKALRSRRDKAKKAEEKAEEELEDTPSYMERWRQLKTKLEIQYLISWGKSLAGCLGANKTGCVPGVLKSGAKTAEVWWRAYKGPTDMQGRPIDAAKNDGKRRALQDRAARMRAEADEASTQLAEVKAQLGQVEADLAMATLWWFGEAP